MDQRIKTSFTNCLQTKETLPTSTCIHNSKEKSKYAHTSANTLNTYSWQVCACWFKADASLGSSRGGGVEYRNYWFYLITGEENKTHN